MTLYCVYGTVLWHTCDAWTMCCKLTSSFVSWSCLLLLWRRLFLKLWTLSHHTWLHNHVCLWIFFCFYLIYNYFLFIYQALYANQLENSICAGCTESFQSGFKEDWTHSLCTEILCFYLTTGPRCLPMLLFVSFESQNRMIFCKADLTQFETRTRGHLAKSYWPLPPSITVLYCRRTLVIACST